MIWNRGRIWENAFFLLIKRIFFTLKEREKWVIKTRARDYYKENRKKMHREPQIEKPQAISPEDRGINSRRCHSKGKQNLKPVTFSAALAVCQGRDVRPAESGES